MTTIEQRVDAALAAEDAEDARFNDTLEYIGNYGAAGTADALVTVLEFEADAAEDEVSSKAWAALAREADRLRNRIIALRKSQSGAPEVSS